jgi:hypothetical protein
MATTNKAFRVNSGLVVSGGVLTLPTGTTTIAPLLFTAGTNLTSATAGVMEYDGTNFYLTPTAGNRKTIAFLDSNITGSAASVSNAITFNTTGGAAAGTTFNGSAAKTIDYSTVGAAASTHSHGNITSAGAIGSTSGLVVVTTTSGVLTTLAAGTSGQFLSYNGTWATPTDTNYYPTTFAWTDGTTSGPTGSLTGSGMSAVSYPAIPSASATVSGIVTTGAQTFAGVKTMTSPSITTSMTTGSTSFDLVNTTATTVNFAGAATAVNIGASTGTTTVNNNMVVSGNLTVNGTTTTVNSTTITVDDKNIELLSTGSATDTLADGGGLTLKGTSDKTFNWVNATGSWTSSENIDLASGKVLKIAGTQVLSAAQYTGNAATVTTNLGTGVLTALGVNVGSAGAVVVNGGALGTPSSATLTNATGLPVSTGITGLGTGVATALAVNVGSSGAVVTNGGALGTPSSATLTNATGLPVATGISGLGTGVATFLATPSSANLRSVITDETGTGSLVFAGSPAFTGTPTIGGVAGIVSTSGTTTGTTALTFSALYSSSTYTGGEFVVKVSNGTNIEITKILVVTDGTNVYMTSYGDVYISSSIASVDFTYTTTDVNMVVTPVAGTTGTTTVKIIGQLL